MWYYDQQRTISCVVFLGEFYFLFDRILQGQRRFGERLKNKRYGSDGKDDLCGASVLTDSMTEEEEVVCWIMIEI